PTNVPTSISEIFVNDQGKARVAMNAGASKGIHPGMPGAAHLRDGDHAFVVETVTPTECQATLDVSADELDANMGVTFAPTHNGPTKQQPSKAAGKTQAHADHDARR